MSGTRPNKRRVEVDRAGGEQLRRRIFAAILSGVLLPTLFAPNLRPAPLGKNARDAAARRAAAPQLATSPIILESSTSIAPDAGNLTCNIAPPDIPLGAAFEIRSSGGTIHLRFDGDFRASWNDTTVSAGQTFQTSVTFLPRVTGSLIDARVGFNYFIVPRFTIDFDELFHTPSKYWGLQDSGLLDYLISGVRQGRFPDPVIPEVTVDRDTTFLTTHLDSLFLLVDSLVVLPKMVDEIPLAYDFSPYPCIRVKANFRVKTTVSYVVAMDTLCVRYSPPGEDLCWAETTDFQCGFVHANTIYDVQVPCATVEDLVVAFCPIKGGGHARVTVNTEVAVDQLKLFYTCDTQIDSIVGTPDSCNVAWINDQYVSVDMGRDDAIYTVPVGLQVVDAQVKTGGSALAAFDTVYAGTDYTIEWTPIDGNLQGCCTVDDSLTIVYSDADSLPSAAAVHFGDIAVVAENVPRQYAWQLSQSQNLPDLPDGSTFRVFLKFFCPNTQKILFRAYTETFYYSNGGAAQ